MLSLLLAFPTLLAALDDDVRPAPPAERVAAAVEALEKAFEAETPEEVASGIQQAPSVPAAPVVAILVDRGLDHASQDVVRASIEALGRLEHEDALSELHAYLRRERRELRGRGGVALLPPLLQAIARHRDESSIPFLVEDMLATPEREVVRARILGLAQIRSRASVEELFSIMRKTDRRKVQPHMGDFQLALIVLTGVDRGTDLDRWIEWWNESKKTFAVTEKAGPMPEELQTRWNRYWGLPRTYDRQKRRDQRGGDGDGR